VKKTPRDWLLERERGELLRLDSIRKAVASTERANALDVMLEIFRPNMPVWAVLAIAWMALAATHLATSAGATRASQRGGYETDLAKLNLTRDEALSFLDPHP
jgi:hypothetical protein